jgi:acetyltransferase-like isoleucine patch superfamily enzyme
MKKYLKQLFMYFRRRQQRLSTLGSLGRMTVIHDKALFNFHQGIQIGSYCRIGRGCFIDGEGGVSIGDGTILAPEVVILSSSHQYKTSDLLPFGSNDDLLPVHIGRGCWLGYRVTIRPGVSIGDGAIVALGAVVVKNVPAGAVVGGNPAVELSQREIKQIEEAVAGQRYYLKNAFENNVSRRKNSLRHNRRKTQ